MWRFATIQPSEIEISFPFSGFLKIIGALFAVSPDSLIGALTPNVLASVNETSTWSASLTGPKIETPAIVFFGPTMSNLDVETYWPGCDKSFFFVN